MKRFDFYFSRRSEGMDAIGVEALEGMGFGTLSPQNFSLESSLSELCAEKDDNYKPTFYCSQLGPQLFQLL